MRTTLRSRLSLLFMSFALLLALPAMAFADDVSNDLDTSVDAVAEVMALNAGGANGTTQLYTVNANGDGKNGCNLTGGTTLGLSVSSSNTSVATVSPSSVTFTGCGESKQLTVTPVAQGSATISVSQTSNTSGGSFNLAPATFTVNVSAAAPANTAPQVSVSGVTGGASYDKGSVPAAVCNVTDAEDGNKSFAADLSAITGPYASDGVGSQTASCSYTDRGGLTASSSETYNIVDPSAPVITMDVTPGTPDGSNGWYKGNVTVDWTVSDPQSPNSLQTTGCNDQDITSDQAATTYSCSATSAGGSAGPESVTIKRDGTAPVITLGSASGTAGTNGWYVSAVSQAFGASDATSGLADSAQASFSESSGAQQGSNVSIGSGDVSDNAGNTASRSAGPFKIDMTAPTVTASPDRAADHNGWYNQALTVSFRGTDTTSGIASCDPAVNYSGPDSGTASVTGQCTDNAGNSANDAFNFKYDNTDPSVSGTLARAADHNGWYNAPVGYSFSGTDATSGIDNSSCTSGTYSGPDGTGLTVSGSCADNAGNSANGSSPAFKYDATKPTDVTFVGAPNAGGSYDYGTAPAAPTCTAKDATSGVEKCVVTDSNSGGFSATGSHTLTATATDNAGNVEKATRTYTVAPYRLSGFYQPVDMGGVINTVKGGSTVPLKFELFQSISGTELTATSGITLTATRTPCDPSSSLDPIEITATGSTSLRYDSTGGQYIYNWKTPTGTGCYTVTMTAADGSTLTAYFQMLK